MDCPDTEPSAGYDALTALLQGALKVYTDGTYSVAGPLIDRIKGVVTKRAAAGIVAHYPDGSYSALRMDLTLLGSGLGAGGGDVGG